MTGAQRLHDDASHVEHAKDLRMCIYEITRGSFSLGLRFCWIFHHFPLNPTSYRLAWLSSPKVPRRQQRGASWQVVILDPTKSAEKCDGKCEAPKEESAENFVEIDEKISKSQGSWFQQIDSGVKFMGAAMRCVLFLLRPIQWLQVDIRIHHIKTHQIRRSFSATFFPRAGQVAMARTS